jgi:putative flippase GtrA
VGVIGVTAGTAAFAASIIGAAVSYVLSRWAWERKGRPDLLRETLPFWVVSVAAWIFLSFVSHEASTWSHHMGHSHWEHVAVVNGAYFLANCITFVLRFVIFNYVLFASRGNKAKAAQVLSSSQQLAEADDPAAVSQAAASQAAVSQAAASQAPESAGARTGPGVHRR